ncbi:MAG: hypothetical protein AMJ81_05830 [Phycisphaerae bacterium SM23_33]|jgi:four helix bundle protein|nr:MAG: hypothetical protein AMJ81_05830 [Phycisphaerae bacterium SM23_33]
MKKRFRGLALRCVRLASTFPKGPIGEVFTRQLVKAATGAAANCRAACVARSRADFISKIGIVEEETDESVFWIDLAVDAGLVKAPRVQALAHEGREILAMVIQSRKTAKSRQTGAKNARKARGAGRA